MRIGVGEKAVGEEERCRVESVVELEVEAVEEARTVAGMEGTGGMSFVGVEDGRADSRRREEDGLALRFAADGRRETLPPPSPPSFSCFSASSAASPPPPPTAAAGPPLIALLKLGDLEFAAGDELSALVSTLSGSLESAKEAGEMRRWWGFARAAPCEWEAKVERMDESERPRGRSWRSRREGGRSSVSSEESSSPSARAEEECWFREEEWRE